MSSRAGRKALVKIPGTAASFTGEAFTDSGDHQTYQITDTTKRVWDPFAAITIKVGGVATGETYTLHRPSGTVVFATVDAGRGAVTADGQYLPMSTCAEAKSYYYTITAQNQDNSAFGDTYMERLQVGKDVAGSLSRWWVDTYFSDALLADTQLVFQFYSDSSSVADLTCWGRLSKRGLALAVKGIVEESIDFEGTTDGGADGIG